MKYYKKLILALVIMIIFSVAIQLGRTYQTSNTGEFESKVVFNDNIENSISKANFSSSYPYTLVIYDKSNDLSNEQSLNVTDNLDYLKVKYEYSDYRDVNAYTLVNYDIVIFMVNDYSENIDTIINNLLEYVKKGGKLLMGMLPNTTGQEFLTLYRKLGIKDFYGFRTVNSFNFVDDLMPGVKGMVLEDEAFADTSLNVSLDENCQVYLQANDEDNALALFWTTEFGEGKIGVNNYGNIGDKFLKGIFVGEFATLLEDFVYPIINATTIFIDDFPSPQYDSISDVIYKVYNRTVKEFYRDIWWPDMLSLAKKYNIVYTGLFVSTYNDIVDPDEFIFEEHPMIKYYGDSLRKNNFELGLHGYNHQPLTLAGGTPGELGYIPWDSIADMKNSITTLLNYSNTLFKNNKYETYVPPSNYLSVEGRQAIIEALPDLKVISGVYEAGEYEESPYIQRFEVANDGIVEFPRITSGMWDDDYLQFQYLNGLAFHGVFSHFIHPDDVLDEARGRNSEWTQLYKDYEKILQRITTNYNGIRSLKASEAGDATRVYDMLEIKMANDGNVIKLACDNFVGEAYFYLRTEKTPIMYNDDYEVINIGEKSSNYYLIKGKTAYIELKLED